MVSVLAHTGWLALGAVALPLAAVPLLLLARHRPDRRESVTMIATALLFGVVLLIATEHEAGAASVLVLAEPVAGLPLLLAVEPLGILFALVASALWIATSLYAIGYMRGHRDPHQTRFYVFFAVAIAATMGIAFAGNLLTLFVCYEALTLATFPLVTHSGTPAARRAGRLYLGLLLGTSIGLMLVAVIATWAVAGTLAFRPGGILEDKASPVLAGVLLALYVFGIGKAAVMPVHRWLPAAMVAPTPVSALLHAVAVVKAGAFSILKIATFVFGFDLLRALDVTQALQGVAGFTVIAASLVALTKDNLKARLAYSTISQLSYIVLAALMAEEAAFVGGGLHIATHGLAKITLFFCAGAILVAAHKSDVSQLDGMGRAMPVTFGAFAVASLSLIGLPPFAGLWSKWLLLEGAVETGALALAGVFAASTLLNIAYLLPIPFRAFFMPRPDGAATPPREAPLPCLVAIVVTATGCVLFFFVPGPALELLGGALAGPVAP